jgi:hypothetical protein
LRANGERTLSARVRQLAQTLINLQTVQWTGSIVDHQAQLDPWPCCDRRIREREMWSGTGQSAWRRLNGCGVSFNRAGPAKRRSESEIYMST